jgi:hypothetical protein
MMCKSPQRVKPIERSFCCKTRTELSSLIVSNPKVHKLDAPSEASAVCTQHYEA